MNPSRFEDSPLGRAKTIITISDAWKRLNLPGEPKHSCRAPWRDDKKPSLSIFENGHRFKDHGENVGGDVIDFVMHAAKVTKSEAARLIISWADFSRTAYTVRPSTHLGKNGRTDEPFPQGNPLQVPHLERGSIDELNTLRISRRLPLWASLDMLHRRGLFGFSSIDGVLCWILTDAARRNAQARPLDPSKAGWSMKAKTLSGSKTSWPIGAADVEGRNIVLICEGPPDLLAVATAAWLERDGETLDDIAFIAMTGAGTSICDEALECLRGKKCRLFIHHDSSGHLAAYKWYEQLDGIAGELSFWRSERANEDFNDFASRHWANESSEGNLPHCI